MIWHIYIIPQIPFFCVLLSDRRSKKRKPSPSPFCAIRCASSIYSPPFISVQNLVPTRTNTQCRCATYLFALLSSLLTILLSYGRRAIAFLSLVVPLRMLYLLLFVTTHAASWLGKKCNVRCFSLSVFVGGRRSRTAPTKTPHSRQTTVDLSSSHMF